MYLRLPQRMNRHTCLIPLLSLCLLGTAFAVNAQNGSGQTTNPNNKTQPKSKTPPPTYLEDQLKAGENLQTFLDRYALAGYTCNITHFYKINKLKENSKPKTGSLYRLPIQLVRYNGKSIRTTLGIEDWETAKRIEQYNREAMERGLRSDNFIRSNELWVPLHEIECADPDGVSDARDNNGKTPTGKMPASEPESASRTFPIFGKQYAKTPLISQRLKGKIFYVVSGHGGPDPGAQGKRSGRTLCEDEYAYDVSLRLLRLLLSHGASAYMIVRDVNDGIRDENLPLCDNDEKVWGNLAIPRDQRERLQQRCDIINALTERHQKAGLNDQTLIEIHVDSRNKLAQIDVFFYFRPGSGSSQRLAQKMQRTFAEKYRRAQNQRLFGGTVTPRYLYMLRETTTPKAVYVELGNIQNGWDQQRLTLKNNRQALANWMCDAILKQ